MPRTADHERAKTLPSRWRRVARRNKQSRFQCSWICLTAARGPVLWYPRALAVLTESLGYAALGGRVCRALSANRFRTTSQAVDLSQGFKPPFRVPLGKELHR